MSNKQHGPVRQLVEQMYQVTRSYMLASGVEAEELLEEWQQVCNDADELDARPRWPQGDAAAEQLARALLDQYYEQDGWIQFAASVLARLAQEASDADYDALAPDWSAAPKWAMWYAIKAGGDAHYYEHEPWLVEFGRTWHAAVGMRTYHDTIELPLGIDWRLCWWRRPEASDE